MPELTKDVKPSGEKPKKTSIVVSISKTTDKAILANWEGVNYWIPKSAVVSTIANHEDPQEIELKDWYYKKAVGGQLTAAKENNTDTFPPKVEAKAAPPQETQSSGPASEEESKSTAPVMKPKQSKAIVEAKPQAALANTPEGISIQEKEYVKNQLFRDAAVSDGNLWWFVNECKARGVRPTSGQLVPFVREGRVTLITTVDYLRGMAQRTNEFEGETPYEWTADGKTWVPVWLDSKPPAAARVGVWRKGFKEPMMSVVTWQSYGAPNLNKFAWKQNGAYMLAKCAEALSLRRAFPHELQGLYGGEEMDQASPTPLPEAPKKQFKVDLPDVKMAEEHLDAEPVVPYSTASPVTQAQTKANEEEEIQNILNEPNAPEEPAPEEKKEDEEALCNALATIKGITYPAALKIAQLREKHDQKGMKDAFQNLIREATQ